MHIGFESALPPRTGIISWTGQVKKVPNSEFVRFEVATLIHDVGASPQSHIGRSEK